MVIHHLFTFARHKVDNLIGIWVIVADVAFARFQHDATKADALGTGHFLV